jgi:hypothetical protein
MFKYVNIIKFFNFSTPFYENATEATNDANDEAEDAESNVNFESTEEQDQFLDALEAEFNNEESEISENFQVWCACHRLQLVVKDFTSQSTTFKGLRAVFLTVFINNNMSF